MNSPIQFDIPKKKEDPLNGFSLGIFQESVEPEIDDEIFTEAVFNNGKSKLDPIVKGFKVVKDTLMMEIGEGDTKDKKDKKDPKKFDPEAFWRNKCFKDLEDAIQKVFGFRAVRIQPYIEKYNSKDGDFESKVLNAYTYPSDRYPIDGVVTNDGFYDKTHSIFMDVFMSLGLIKALEAEELTAVFLHEFGHNIDPVLVDIKYMETNILSKYLTDRDNQINKNEKRYMNEHNFVIIVVIVALIMAIPNIISWIYEKIVGKDRIEQKKLEKIQKMVKNDKEEFNRKNFSEAFADNFARMYGFGAQLMSALKKLSKSVEDQMKSIYKKERRRREAIMWITEMTIKDEHKTDIHRIHALINEYKEDLKDPNIPKKVKESLQADLKELETVLDHYLNDFDSFQNKVNKAILEELQKKDSEDKSKEEKKDTDKDKNDDKKTEKIKESVSDDYYHYESYDKYCAFSRGLAKKQFELYGNIVPILNTKEFKESGLMFHFGRNQLITESKKAYKELMDREKTVTSAERAEFYKIFGNSKECSLAKDKDGYYVYTHRARSKSYPSIDKIPERDVKFVRSTS